MSLISDIVNKTVDTFSDIGSNVGGAISDVGHGDFSGAAGHAMQAGFEVAGGPAVIVGNAALQTVTGGAIGPGGIGAAAAQTALHTVFGGGDTSGAGSVADDPELQRQQQQLNDEVEQSTHRMESETAQMLRMMSGFDGGTPSSLQAHDSMNDLYGTEAQRPSFSGAFSQRHDEATPLFSVNR